MSELVIGIAAASALIAAVRSTWSPCGLSMLSAMTPITEQGRGYRYWPTTLWYLAGAIVGGVTVGALFAVGAWAASALGLSTTGAAAVVVAVATITGLADLGVGWSLPIHRRQVDEDWFAAYRRWLYASGFGWQIGNGFATYTTTACLYLVAAAAVVTSDPFAALAVGTAFGTVRGLAVFLGARLRTFDDVRRLHARLDRWSTPSRLVTGAAQLVLAATAAVAVGPVGLVLAGLVAIVSVGWRTLTSRHRASSAPMAAGTPPRHGPSLVS